MHPITLINYPGSQDETRLFLIKMKNIRFHRSKKVKSVKLKKKDKEN